MILLYILLGFCFGWLAGVLQVFYVYHMGDLRFYQDEDGTYPVIEGYRTLKDVQKRKFVLLTVRQENVLYSGTVEEEEKGDDYGN